MRAVELAVYADALAGEAASLSARAERARSRLRQAAIEKGARVELTAIAVQRLEALGLLGAIDEPAARAELRELEAALDALEELQSWSRASSRPLPRRETDQEAAVVVVGWEEIHRHRLHVPDPRAQLELLPEPSNAPFDRDLRGAVALEPGQPERLDHVASHQLLLAEAGELEHVAPARDDARVPVTDDETRAGRRVVVLEQFE